MKEYKYCVVDFVNCMNHYCRDEKEVEDLIKKLDIPETLYWIKKDGVDGYIMTDKQLIADA